MPTALDEVVIPGFRYRQEKDLTGAVSSIDSKLISSQSNSTLSRALEGAIPGMQVASIDGQPGVDMGIRVPRYRFRQQMVTRTHLIVIDGVPNTNSNALSSTLNPGRYRIDHGSEGGCRFDRPVGFARRQRRRYGNDQKAQQGAPK